MRGPCTDLIGIGGEMILRESELQKGRRVAVVEDDHHFTSAGFIVHDDVAVANSPLTGTLGRFCQKPTIGGCVSNVPR